MHGWRHWPRRLALIGLKRVARDITIRHHHTGEPVRLNIYTHKGYWYHGKRREAATLALCGEIFRPGWTVYDVGGHIGYLSLYFARLAGPHGHVHVFEPGENNLPYLERNIAGHSNITLVRAAAGAAPGRATLYVESLAGQNNSLVEDFEVLARNAGLANPGAGKVTPRDVEVTTLDSYAGRTGAIPDIVKIDVEGFELEVLLGMTELIGRRPVVLVEVQRNQEHVVALLERAGYQLFNDRRKRLRAKNAHRLNGANVFALHAEAHAGQIASLFTPARGPASAPSRGSRNS